MKKYIVLALAACLCSCNLDNYDSPNASLYGRVINAETGEPIMQDIVNGSLIQIVQLDWSDAEDSPRYLNFKTDGSYCENNLFAGKYEISVVKANFGTFKDTIEIKGNKRYDIMAKANVEIDSVSIDYNSSEGEIKASFKLTSSEYLPLKSVAIVGASTEMTTTNGTKSVLAESFDCAGMIDESRWYTMTMVADALEDGDYYFRVAAKTDASSLFNYSTEATRISLNSSLIKEKGLLFDDCDSDEAWKKGVLDKNIKRKGNASITNTLNPTLGTMVYFQKVLDKPFDTQCEMNNCVFSFYLYVDTKDIAAFNAAKKGQIEFSSSGKYDQNEITFYWQNASGLITMPELSIGWNKIELPIVGVDFAGKPAKARMNMGAVDFSALNFFRVYLEKGSYGGDVTLKVDQIRVYDKTKEY